MQPAYLVEHLLQGFEERIARDPGQVRCKTGVRQANHPAKAGLHIGAVSASGGWLVRSRAYFAVKQ